MARFLKIWVLKEYRLYPVKPPYLNFESAIGKPFSPILTPSWGPSHSNSRRSEVDTRKQTQAEFHSLLPSLRGLTLRSIFGPGVAEMHMIPHDAGCRRFRFHSKECLQSQVKLEPRALA